MQAENKYRRKIKAEMARLGFKSRKAYKKWLKKERRAQKPPN